MAFGRTPEHEAAALEAWRVRLDEQGERLRERHLALTPDASDRKRKRVLRAAESLERSLTLWRRRRAEFVARMAEQGIEVVDG